MQGTVNKGPLTPQLHEAQQWTQERTRWLMLRSQTGAPGAPAHGSPASYTALGSGSTRAAARPQRPQVHPGLRYCPLFTAWLTVTGFNNAQSNTLVGFADLFSKHDNLVYAKMTDTIRRSCSQLLKNLQHLRSPVSWKGAAGSPLSSEILQN